MIFPKPQKRRRYRVPLPFRGPDCGRCTITALQSMARTTLLAFVVLGSLEERAVYISWPVSGTATFACPGNVLGNLSLATLVAKDVGPSKWVAGAG